MSTVSLIVALGAVVVGSGEPISAFAVRPAFRSPGEFGGGQQGHEASRGAFLWYS